VCHTHDEQQRIADAALKPESRRGVQGLLHLVKGDLPAAGIGEPFLCPEVLAVDHDINVSRRHTPAEPCWPQVGTRNTWPRRRGGLGIAA
jgi:hypothetical protein